MSQDFNAAQPESGVTTFGQLYQIVRNHFEAVRSRFSGTAFPASPVQGQYCFRTDRGTYGLAYVYTGNTAVGESGWVEDALLNTVGLEVVAARGSKSSLDARLDVALNEDGTLKASTTLSPSQWTTISGATFTYVSTTEFRVVGDQTDIYTTTRRIKANLAGGAAYSEVLSATYSAPNTTVTLKDAVLTDPITSIEHSLFLPTANQGAMTPAMLGAPALAAANEFTASQKLKGDALLWRFKDTGGSGKEWGLRSDGGNLEVCENTGTEGSPTWMVRKTFVAGAADSSEELVKNLKPVRNATVNYLDIFTKSGGAVADATNRIRIAIPDGNGYTYREDTGTYLSGTRQIRMADGANYWSKGSVNGDYKRAYLYAIWDGTGIVYALAGYAGFSKVPTTTTATDDDFFLIEQGSTYTRNSAHYCVAVATLVYEYDTGDSPDHTIYQEISVLWNPRSDYGKCVPLATTVSSAGDIAEQAVITTPVAQTGRYRITAHSEMSASSSGVRGRLSIKTGSGTYASATYRVQNILATGYHPSLAHEVVISATCSVFLNSGQSIHIGAGVEGGGTRSIYGTSSVTGGTVLTFERID